MIDRSERQDYETELRRNKRRTAEFILTDDKQGPKVTCVATGIFKEYGGSQWVYHFKLDLEAGFFERQERKPIGFHP